MSETDQKPPTLSIVIPAYNEARRIKRSLTDIQSFFKTWPMDHEIIVVVEKSSDETLKMAKDVVGDDPNFKIIANKIQRGKGYAVRTGMLKAQGEFVFYMDLDLSTPLVEVMAFLGWFEAAPKTDIIIGSRQHPHSEVIVRQSHLRQKMGQFFNLLVKTFAFGGIADTQCGFKAFRKKTVLPIFSRQKINGFSFDVEVLMLAKKLGFKVEVHPVKWINSKESKVNIIKDSMKMFFDLLRIPWIVGRSMRQQLPAAASKKEEKRSA